MDTMLVPLVTQGHFCARQKQQTKGQGSNTCLLWMLGSTQAMHSMCSRKS